MRNEVLAPIDTRGWTSAVLEVRASSVRRPVRVVALSMQVGPDGRVEPDGGEPVGVIDIEGHGERLLVAALATPLPGLVGMLESGGEGGGFGEGEIAVELVG